MWGFFICKKMSASFMYIADDIGKTFYKLIYIR